ncbi:hypothetical protein [Streptomyces sp. NPDC001843]|uniref:hypothetical protein n=1 Tax=Streptomyces sp. NPDC001843 TaxID=3364617 RepID=UPI0036B0A40C
MTWPVPPTLPFSSGCNRRRCCSIQPETTDKLPPGQRTVVSSKLVHRKLAGRHRIGADIVAGVIYEGTMGMDEGAPTTAHLHDVLNRAGRVVIAEAPPDEADSAGVARIVVTGAEIAELARVLAIVDGGTGDRCRCKGWPTLMVHDVKGELIACWTLHHQSSLRGIGDCDADLRDGPALTEWLAERGLTGSREVQAGLAVQEAEEDRRRLRWLQAAPAGLRESAMEVSNPPGRDLEAWSDRLRDAKAQLATLGQDGCPEGIERIRALLAWVGVSARESTGGLKWYDMVVQQLLLAEDPDLIIAALATGTPSPGQLDGAAQLFSSLEWTTAHGKDLAEPLRSMLIAHIQADGTDPMKFRMRHGYYGAERSA